MEIGAALWVSWLGMDITFYIYNTIATCRLVILEFIGLYTYKCLRQSCSDKHGSRGSCQSVHSRQHWWSLRSKLDWGEL